LPDLIRAQVVDVGLAVFDELDGILVHLLEVIGCEVQPVFPVEAEPAHAILYRFDVFFLFLGRISVVEAQVALAAVLLCDAEVEAYRFGMADVEVAVRLRWEARVNAPFLFIGLKIFVDDIPDKIGGH
jgi:hypothetical protein